MITLLFFAGYAFVAYLVLAVALLPVGKWLRYRRATFLRAAVTVGLWAVLGIAALYFTSSVAAGAAAISVRVGALVLGIAAEILIVMGVLGARLGRATAGWALLQIPRALIIVLALFLVRDHLFSAYRVTALSMAPTIMPVHATGVCPFCGGTVYFDVDPQFLAQHRTPAGAAAMGPIKVTGTCTSCGKETSATLTSLTPLAADHFIVVDGALPRRWDLIAYHASASNIYVKRVVGLPGETVAIDKDGHVIVDGKDAGGPPDNPKLRYPWPTDDLMLRAFKLHPGEPLKLGAGQYFILGDDSFASADTRINGPLKQSDIVGVVTLLYAPLSRFHVFR